MNKILSLLAMLVCIGVVNLQADSWTWTCSNGNSFSTSAFTLNGKSWTSSIAGSSTNAGSKQSPMYVIQVDKNNGCTLTTSSISGTINSISVESLSSAQKTLTIKVGTGTGAYTSNAQNISTSEYDAVSFNNINKSGQIQLIWSSSNKALRIKSITINYTTASCTANPSVAVASLNGSII